MFLYLPNALNLGARGLFAGLVLATLAAAPAAAFTTLSGTIRDAEGSPIRSVVFLWSDREVPDRSDNTDDDGRYSFNVSPNRTYYLTTRTIGYVDEAWDDLPCHDSGFGGINGRPRLCEPIDGTPLVLAPEEQRSGIDFVLERQSTIQGVVRGPSGVGLAFAHLQLFFPFGVRLNNAISDEDGVFEFERLDPGTYYLTASQDGFADQIWDGGACHVTWGTPRLTCDPAAEGTPLIVDADKTVSGIEVRMRLQGSITGEVRDEVTGEPVEESIETYTSDGQLIHITHSTDGRYEVPGLNTSNYHLLARGHPSFQDWVTEIYDDIPCSLPDCDPMDGTPVQVVRGAQTAGIDIALTPAGTLSGRLLDAGTGEGPVDWIRRSIFDDTGRLVHGITIISSTRDPRSEHSATLLPGSYRVVTWGDRYAAEVLGAAHCANPFDEESCDPSLGVPVVVEPGVDTPGVDLVLDRFPRLSGSVVNRETGNRVRSSVRVWAEDGERATSAASGVEGWVADVTPGTYFLTVTTPFDPYVGQLYEEQVCDFYDFEILCDVTAGAPVPLGFGEERQIDFALDMGGVLDVNLHPPAGFPGFLGFFTNVTLRTGSGREITSQSVTARAFFEGIGDAPYRLTASSRFYPPQHFDRVLCSDPECSQPEGQIVAGRSRETQRVDWNLIANGTLSGQLHNAESGEQLPSGGRIGLFDETGMQVGTAFGTLDAYHLPSPRPGRYRVAATASGFLAHVLGQGDCPGTELASCEFTDGTVFELSYDQIVHGVDFDLTPACPESTLCVTDGRFEVRATWTDFMGASGPATPTPLTDQAGTFWFFSPDNVELVVKVLDACEDPFHRFWVFAAGLTDVDVELEVVDTATQQARTYTNALGEPFQPILDTDAFATCGEGSALAATRGEVEALSTRVVEKSSTCGEPGGLCLGDRFRVDVVWDTGEQTGSGVARPLTADSGYFYFFSPDNLEVVVKVLDACQDPFRRFWVFAAGLTDVGVTMTVTDSLAEESKTYRNALGEPFSPILDTDAFATCP